MDDMTQEMAKMILEDRRDELTNAGLESIMAGFIAPTVEIPWDVDGEVIDAVELAAAINAEEHEALVAEIAEEILDQVPLLAGAPPKVGVEDPEAEDNETITVPWWELKAQEATRRQAKKKGARDDTEQMDLFGAILAGQAAEVAQPTLF
jgi:hypothetical protein